MLRIALLASLLAADFARAITTNGRFHSSMKRLPGIPHINVDGPIGPVVSRNGTQLPPFNQTFWFDQLIDHNNPSLGTFKQRFWHTWEFYEPGGPIIIMTPGEVNADGFADSYITNRTINGQIAQQQSGSAVLIEHRFFGLSNPINDLSVDSLQFQSIQQAIDDLEYFAKNVVLPQPGGDQLTPDKAPWVLVGGSYGGALVSWTMVNKPGVFAAGYASSAVVETILNFWQYYEPIRENMPANCSADVQVVIAHIDQVFNGTNQTAIQEIKELFGMGDVSHLDDVGAALKSNIFDWQSLQPTSGSDTDFRMFCDALEVKDGVSAPPSGWGLTHALQAWGDHWTKDGYLDELCGGDDPEDCLGTHDPTQDFWTDTSVGNDFRAWFWIVCHQVGWFQDTPPPKQPSLVTRLVDPSYDLRQCQFMFPAAFPEPPTVDTQGTNKAFHGWNVQLKNIFFANGKRDPWRDATISAEGLNVQSTPEQPIALSDGFHTSDLSTASAQVDPTIARVQKAALASMKRWLAEWTPSVTSDSARAPVPQNSGPIPQAVPPIVHAKPLNAWNKGFGAI